MADPPDPDVRSRDRVELVATVLMALAAVATAWCSFQATRWNGEQARAASKTNATRIEAAREEGLFDAQREVDVALFTEWVDAELTGDQELAGFYEARFRDEFVPAFDAWIATDPFTDPDAPETPFAMDEYRLAAEQRTQQLDDEAEEGAATVREAIQRSSNYVLGVVMFAVVLFFAGMSGKVGSLRSKRLLVGVGSVIFAGTLVLVATYPVSFSV